MSLPYPGTSVTGYNANPPPDDGTEVATNEITWAGIKTKIGDPLDTFAGDVDSNLTSAFEKLLDGSSVVSTSTSYAAGAADQGKLIVATASGVTITTPDATSVGTPFVFAINNQSTGTITLAGNADGSQTVDGETSQIIQPGGGAIVKTDGSNWFTFGLQPAQPSSGGANLGFNQPINAQLSASVASNLLTVNLLTAAGGTPSAGSPVQISFRDTTLANGDPVTVSVEAACSISTNATGATLGTQNSVPFRLWVLAFNNAGTVELALWHSGAGSSAPVLNPLNEGVLESTTGIGSGATSAGVFYTPNGVTLTSCAFRILGYVEYASGLTTAGTYASAPTIVQLFGPGIRKPGEPVQMQQNTATSTTGWGTSSTFVKVGPTVSITPTSKANIVRVSGGGPADISSSSAVALWQYGLSLTASFSAIGMTGAYGPGDNASAGFAAYCQGWTQPQSTSQQTYQMWGCSNNAQSAGNIGTWSLEAVEYQA